MQQTTTIGHQYGHWLRRLIHVSTGIFPIFYYWANATQQRWLHLSTDQLVSLIVLLALLFEAIRLWQGWLVLGQRDYEARHISAFAWTMLATGLVLLIAPKVGYQGAAIGLPLLWSLALADPIMGEYRRYDYPKYLIIGVGAIIVAMVWLLGYYWLGTPGCIIPFVVPVTIVSEQLKSSQIDDNALMLLLPLACILLILPWC